MVCHWCNFMLSLQKDDSVSKNTCGGCWWLEGLTGGLGVHDLAQDQI